MGKFQLDERLLVQHCIKGTDNPNNALIVKMIQRTTNHTNDTLNNILGERNFAEKGQLAGLLHVMLEGWQQALQS